MKFSIRKKEKCFYFIGKDDKGIDIFTSENFQNYDDCLYVISIIKKQASVAKIFKDENL